MLVWTVVLFAIVRDALHELPRRAVRPREHGAGRLEHVDGRPLETTRRRPASRSVASAVHVDPFLVLLAPLWVLWPSPLALAFAQIVVVSLGALPVFWLVAATSGPSARLACWRSATSRIRGS